MPPPNETAEPLPKTTAPAELPGSVLPQFVRCGKPRCRCASGDLHGPYFYRFWRADGRLRKAYVRPHALDATRAACARRRARERRERERSRETRALIASFRARSREVERLLGLLRERTA